LTAGTRQSVRRTGRTDSRRRRTRTAADPAGPAAGDPGSPGHGDDLLTISEVTAWLRVSRTTFYRWRLAGAGLAVVRLPGGGVRIRRSDLHRWLRARLEQQAEENTDR
jgi:excisionase family DNA binding protein